MLTFRGCNRPSDLQFLFIPWILFGKAEYQKQLTGLLTLSELDHEQKNKLHLMYL